MAFENVYITPRVRAALARVLHPKQHSRFWNLVTKLQQGRFDVPGLNVEKLYIRRDKVYSARMNIEMRVIFSVHSLGQGKRCLIIEDVDHHDDAYNRADRLQGPVTVELVTADGAQTHEFVSEDSIDTNDEQAGGLLFRVPHYMLGDPEKYVTFERNMDRYLRLSDEQEELLHKTDIAYLVQGSAGTGKTTLALFYALNVYESNPSDTIFLFTYHDELACVCRAYKVNLLGDADESSDGGGMQVFSYLDFCRTFLKANVVIPGGRWISKEESLAILQKVLSSKPRWQRNFDVVELYNLIYSILKGRFVPGTDRLPVDRDDYARVFKDYGRVPADMEDTLEVFNHYERWLKGCKLFDEADLIRLSYENLKNRAVLGNERAGWIVIDEIQDFTELEWKSIMLLWENQCARYPTALSYPFVCGDVNQNISRSGFRWQELQSYIEGIFKKFHRPNSVVKVQLHSNFRNTREIYELGTFLRSLGNEPAADLGLPPSHHGDKPLLVVGTAADFLEFANGVAERGNPAEAPLVILSEDEDGLPALRRSLSENENCFLLPLKSSKGMEFEDAIIYRPFSTILKCARSDLEASRVFDLWYMGVTRARRRLLLFVTTEDLQALRSVTAHQFERFAALTETAQGSALEHLISFYRQREQYLPNYNVVFLESRVAEDLWQEYQRVRQKSDNSINQQTSGTAPADTTVLRPHDSEDRQQIDHLNSCFNEGSAELAKNNMLDVDDLSNYIILGGEVSAVNSNVAALSEDQAELLYAERCKERALRLWSRCRAYGRLGRALFEIGRFEEALPYLHRSGLIKETAICLEETGLFLDAAAAYIQCMYPQDAARCFEYAGEYVKAAEIYSEHENWVMAAETFCSGGQFERAAAACIKAGMFRSAADIYRLRGDYLLSAQAYQKVGDYLSAGEMFLKVKEKLEAANCFEKVGRYQQAASLFESMSRWGEAAELYEKASMLKKSAQLYGKAGKLRESGRLLESIGDRFDAAQMYERGHDWENAARLFLTVQRKDRAAKCLQASGSFVAAASLFAEIENNESAARCYEESGDLSTAACYYTKSGNFNGAGYCFERLERLNEAADAYLKSNNMLAAASVLTKLGRISDAARLYLLSGQAATAMEIVRSGGKQTESVLVAELIAWACSTDRPEIEADILEHTRSHLEAARKFEQCMLHGRAASNFEKCSKFGDAGRCYVQDGKLEDAARCFKKNNQWKQAATCLESLKRWEEAGKLYERCNDTAGVTRCRNALNWF